MQKTLVLILFSFFIFFLHMEDDTHKKMLILGIRIVRC